MGRGVQPTKGSFRYAEGFKAPEGSSPVTAIGQGGRATGGVYVQGTYEEDGPATWEALPFLKGEDSKSETFAAIRRFSKVMVKETLEKIPGVPKSCHHGSRLNASASLCSRPQVVPSMLTVSVSR